MALFKQCNLATDTGSTTISWIDTKYAKEGVRVRFKDETIWRTIKRVFHGVTLTEEQVQEASMLHRKQREASDI